MAELLAKAPKAKVRVVRRSKRKFGYGQALARQQRMVRHMAEYRRHRPKDGWPEV